MVAFIGVGSLLIRVSFIATLGRVRLPDWIPEALRYVPPAILAALTVPAVVLAHGELAFSFDNERLGAALVAAVVAWFTKNPALTVVAGLAALWIIRALGS